MNPQTIPPDAAGSLASNSPRDQEAIRRSAAGLLPILREWGKLSRIEGGGFAVVAIFGAFAAGGSGVEVGLLIGLFVVNLLFLLGTCIHNDWADIHFDCRADKLRDWPLVKGTISLTSAAAATILCLLGSLGFAVWLTRSTIVAGTLAAAILLALLYNWTSKRLCGADLFFAVSAALICLCGGAAATANTDSISTSSHVLLAVAGIVMIDHFFFAAVEGGLKDIDTDGAVGAPTIVHCVFQSSNNVVRMAPAAQVFFLILKSASVALVFLPLFAFGFPYWTWQLVTLGLASALTLFFTWQILSVDALDRRRVKRLTRLQEMACRSLVPILLSRVAGIGWLAVLFLVPFLWFVTFNWLLHRKAFTNPKSV